MGVHIRRSDFTRVFPGSKVGLGKFEEIVENEISKGNLVYLCSDEGDVKKNFKVKYGEEIFTYDFGYEEDYHTTGSNQGVADALVEILTLRKTKKIIQTNQSSFSYLAALWGDVELMGAVEYE